MSEQQLEQRDTGVAPEQAEDELPMFDEVTVAITCTFGKRDVQGMAHPLAPGLAVTMNHFGEFDVTHTATGFTVVKGFERFANAAVALLAHACCADWTQQGPDISAYLKGPAGDEPANVPGFTTTSGGETKPTSKRDVVRSYRGIQRRIVGEFPWEDNETSPHAQITRIIEVLNRPSRYTPEPAAS